MSRRRFGSIVAAVAFCGVLASCQTTAHRAALPPVDESRDPAPPLHLRQLMQAPDGANASWDALRGKVVLLEFWATWCGPCIAAIPHLNELAETFADEPVVFLAITDEENELVERFLGRREMKSWIGLDDDGQTHRAYGVSGIPHTVIVDQHGRIAAVTYPTHVTEEVIRSVLEGRDAGLSASRDSGSTITAGVDPTGDNEEDALLRVIIREGEGAGSTSFGSGKLTADGVRVRDVVAMAYNISRTRIEGLDHLPDSRYTIVVQAPRHDGMRSVLRASLDAAFQFSATREQRRRRMYVLRERADEPHKLQPTAMEGGSSMHMSAQRYQVVNAPPASLALFLESALNGPVDYDGQIPGQFDITLEFDSEMQQWEESRRVEHIIATIRDQLGLDLVEEDREIEVLVITPVDAEE